MFSMHFFFLNTVSPPYTVVLYPVNSDLRCLVITTLDSIYGKKNSEIRYLCLFTTHRRITPTQRGHQNNVFFR